MDRSAIGGPIGADEAPVTRGAADAGVMTPPDWRWRSMRVRLATALAIVTLCAGCSSVAGPEGDVCASRDSIRICVEKSRYAPAQLIRFSISNGTGLTLFEDVCARHIAGRNDVSKPFDTRYSPARRCRWDADAAEIARHFRTVPADGITEDSVRISGYAIQGEFQLQIWFRGPDSMLISDQPYVSGSFEMHRSAP